MSKVVRNPATTSETPECKGAAMAKLSIEQALLKATSHAKKRETEEAQRLYQAVLQAFPKNKRAQQGLASLNKPKQSTANQAPPQDTINQLLNLYNQGQLSAAAEKAKALTQQYPDAFVAWSVLGAAAAQTGQLDKAIIAFQRVVSIKPDYADGYNNIGNALQKQGKLKEAIEAYSKALSLKPDYAEAYNNIGITLKDQGKLEEAIEAYSKALSLKPDYAEAYNNIGITLKDQGKLEEAIEAYNKALSLKPDYTEAHRHLSAVTKYNPNARQISEVEALLQHPNLNDAPQCSLRYAYAKMKEDVGDLSAAFDSYVAGAALRKKTLAYDFSQDQHLFTKIKNTAPKLKELSLNKSIGDALLTPIFILGMPRSGTTLAEQIISSHTQVTGAGELPYVSQFGFKLAIGAKSLNAKTLQIFRENYLAELAKRTGGKKFITDKMPQNFQYVALICSAFPEAKIIHTQRNAQATCWSNFKHYFASTGLGYSYNLADTVSYYCAYENIMDLWQQSFGNRIYNLDYDKLTEDQEPETRRLIEYLGLNWESGCLAPQHNNRPVKTASQQQVRQEIYKGSSQAWRKYEPFLDGVFDGLKNDPNRHSTDRP